MSTHKITPETKVPFPCWLYNRATLAWCWHFTEENLHVNHIHYSTNPPDQPPLGEPAPEGSLPVTEPEKCEVCGGDEPCSHDFDKIAWPTPSAPSLQSVAEGAARELLEVKEPSRSVARRVENALSSQADISDRVPELAAILTRHFAPLLTERDERIKQLEVDNNTLRAAQKACEDCMTPTYAALRTRCEEMEKGLRDAVNASCSCGGEPAESAKACPACMVWHRIRAARKEGQQAHEKGEGA